jgi:hypothetical protein
MLGIEELGDHISESILSRTKIDLSVNHFRFERTIVLDLPFFTKKSFFSKT